MNELLLNCEEVISPWHDQSRWLKIISGKKMKGMMKGLTPWDGMQVILQNLFICTVVFYTVYYFTYTLCFLALRLESFDEFGPFDFKTSPSWSNRKYLGNLFSLETTFLACSACFVLIVEEWIWDYACTITVIHVGITSLIMKELPTVTHWWTSLGLGLLSMIFAGQLLAYLLYKENFIYPDLCDF